MPGQGIKSGLRLIVNQESSKLYIKKPEILLMKRKFMNKMDKNLDTSSLNIFIFVKNQ